MGRAPKKMYVIGTEAFVPSRYAGYWIRTHVCVIHVSCTACHAPIGRACTHSRGHEMGGTHYVRRDAYKAIAHKPHRTDDHRRLVREVQPRGDAEHAHGSGDRVEDRRRNWCRGRLTTRLRDLGVGEVLRQDARIGR